MKARKAKDLRELSTEELEKIHRQIKSIEGVSRTKTYCVLKNVKGEA